MCSERAGQDRGKLLLFCVLFWCSLFSVLRVMEQWNAGRCKAVIALPRPLSCRLQHPEYCRSIYECITLLPLLVHTASPLALPPDKWKFAAKNVS